MSIQRSYKKKYKEQNNVPSDNEGTQEGHGHERDENHRLNLKKAKVK